MKRNRQPARLERQLQSSAHRRATKQLLLVPWSRFYEAYEEYIRLEAIVLWVRALSRGESAAGPLVASTIRTHFPGFLDSKMGLQESPLLGFNLHAWVHNQVFASAREEGWLDALVFYGVRDPRSQSAWALWEQYEKKWRRRAPSNCPSVQKWLRLAQAYSPQGMRVRYLTGTVERYIDWKAFSHWLEPWHTDKVEAPKLVREALRTRCPHFPAADESGLFTVPSRAQTANRFMAWVEDHLFTEAEEQGCLRVVRRQTRLHPRYARLARYSKHWNKSWSANLGSQYPSFVEWCRAAEDYTET